MYLKKQKKKRVLDLPPPPLPEHPKETPEEHLPNFEEETIPDFSEELSLPEMPELSIPLPEEPPLEEIPEPTQLEFPEIPEVPEEQLPDISLEEPISLPEPVLPQFEQPFSTQKSKPLDVPPLPPKPIPKPVIPQPTPMQEPAPMVRREQISQLFVSIDDYQVIMQGLNASKKTLQTSQNLVEELNRIKNKEDKIFEDWKVQIEDIERKLSFIDQAIAKGERA